MYIGGGPTTRGRKDGVISPALDTWTIPNQTKQQDKILENLYTQMKASILLGIVLVYRIIWLKSIRIIADMALYHPAIAFLQMVSDHHPLRAPVYCILRPRTVRPKKWHLVIQVNPIIPHMATPTRLRILSPHSMTHSTPQKAGSLTEWTGDAPGLLQVMVLAGW